MIVMKFGGTSVESADAIRRVASIVGARVDRKPIVVVSAMGKTTNKLLAIANHAVAGRRSQSLDDLKQLHEFHLEHARPFNVPDQVINEVFQELEEMVRGVAVLKELTPRSIDAVSAFGERLSSVIVAAAFNHLGLPAVHLDSRRVILTDDRHTHAAPLLDRTYSRLADTIPPLTQDRVVVMAGFIASTAEGVTSTLGRGGSDFTASIVGAGVHAEEIQIWTDVDGMLTADPTVLPGGRRVRVISFAEAAELAYFGAKVLHPSTVLPAMQKNIPVLVLNSRRPEVEGTRIVAERVPCKVPIKSIACKKNIALVNINSTRMLMAHGFLHRVFKVFDKHETPIDVVATSEVSLSMTVDDPSRIEDIVRDISEFAATYVEPDQAIICLVGDNVRYQPGVACRAFRALESVNIRMISQGASLLNLTLVVSQDDLKEAVEKLHTEFFSDPDPAVFD